MLPGLKGRGTLAPSCARVKTVVTRLQGLYAIADVGPNRASQPGGPAPERMAPVELVAAFVRGGASVVQLRWKEAPAGAFVEAARRAASICREAGVLFLINDRVDVAALSGAGGVHLGQEPRH